MALDSCQNFVSTQYLKNEWMEFDKIWHIGGVIQKYAEKCHYFHNFNTNYIIFVHNQAKFMLI